MAEAEYTYKCLRCGHEYKALYDPDCGAQELTCPACRSNSVRRLPPQKSEKKNE